MNKTEKNIFNSGSMSQYSIPILARFFDFIAVIIAGLIAFKTRFFEVSFSEMPDNYLLMISYAALISLIVFPWFGLYRSWRGESAFHQLRIAFIAWTVVWLTVLVALFSFKASAEYSRIWVTVWYFMTLITMITVRRLIYYLLNELREKGFNHKKIVIYGAGVLGGEILNRVQAAKWTGLDVIALFDDNAALENSELSGVRILTDSKTLSEYVKNHNVDEVWLTLPLRAEDKVKSIMYELRHNVVNIKLLPDIFGMRLINHSVGEMLGLPIVNLSSTPMDGSNQLLKAIEDKLLSIIIIVLISPLLLIVASGVKLTSPGPVLFRQERVGWNGDIFTMLKFRSMPMDVEKDNVSWGGAKDKTSTKFGAFIRKTSLDELPQFFNVLKGDMSIVGPRPERKVFVDQFKEEIPDYMKKHLVKAGVTGWAQINGWRGDTDLTKRIEYDMFYIENWSLWFDLKIIFLTVFKGFMNKNAC